MHICQTDSKLPVDPLQIQISLPCSSDVGKLLQGQESKRAEEGTFGPQTKSAQTMLCQPNQTQSVPMVIFDRFLAGHAQTAQCQK